MKPQKIVQAARARGEKLRSGVFSNIMESTSHSLAEHIKNQNVVTYRIVSNNPNLRLETLKEDFASNGLFGQVRYGGARNRTQFIFTTNLPVPPSLAVANRYYSISPFTERIQTALATIHNIPFGAGPLIHEWVQKIGNVVEITLPNETTDTSTDRGQVKFSHIYFAKAFSLKDASIPIKGLPPVTLQFASYVKKNQEFFLADEPTRTNLILQRALNSIEKKYSKSSKSYKEAVLSSSPSPTLQKSPLKKKPTNKRSRNSLKVSPSNRSPPSKKPLIEEIKMPELKIIVSPLDIFPSNRNSTSNSPFTPMVSKRNKHDPPGRGHS